MDYKILQSNRWFQARFTRKKKKIRLRGIEDGRVFYTSTQPHFLFVYM